MITESQAYASPSLPPPLSLSLIVDPIVHFKATEASSLDFEMQFTVYKELIKNFTAVDTISPCFESSYFFFCL